MPPPQRPQAVSFTVNGRAYRTPARPIAVICMDGCADEYLNAAFERARMPRLQELCLHGYRGLARAALPTFTNVNNAAIAAGRPPSVTGISGNYFLDPRTGEEVMMNSAAYLRCDTILAAAARAGRRVAMITAKEKLRDLLSRGLLETGNGIAFSAEKAVEAMVGRPAPPIYSAAASLYVLEAGCRLLERGLADFLYLSLTDYMQHKFAPAAEESLEFHAALDLEIGRLLDLGVVIGATADHGMNAKTLPGGGPNVIYLESRLEERFGAGSRVICPITDPYVLHHGALGSMVSVHLPPHLDAAAVGRWIYELDGVTEVYSRDLAARKLELPADRIGDLVVFSGRGVVLGRRPEDHDLSRLSGSLRSHGGRYEEMVPMLLSSPLKPEYAAQAAADPRNFDIFDFTLNGLELEIQGRS